nr:GNAT family N-acetyltransferase [uncultured Cohaesibacter sp.]
MPDRLTIRPIKANDVEPATRCGLGAWCHAILPLLDGYGPLEIPHIEQLFRTFLLSHLTQAKEHEADLMIADLGGQVLGFYCLEHEIGDLTDLWLDPEWHGKAYLEKSIASHMMADAKARARTAGCDCLTLKVLVGNQRALAFYRKEGMQELSRDVDLDTALQQRLEKITMQLRLES